MCLRIGRPHPGRRNNAQLTEESPRADGLAPMRNPSGRGEGLAPAALVLVLVLCVLAGGLLPLSMPVGLAAGGVLQTGQAEPSRWWLSAAGALVVFAIIAAFARWRVRAWWLAMLVSGIAISVGLFVGRVSWDQPRPPLSGASTEAPTVGIVTALPLFWPEGAAPPDLIAHRSGTSRSPLIGALRARAVDSIDERMLSGVNTLILAQPRLLAPVELVGLDNWIRRGGRAVIFADPLLMWPSALSVADPRRATLTSLLDPLLTHWGLRLQPVSPDERALRRIMLSDGHVLIVAGASRFTRTPGESGGGAPCALAERGLMALCRIGRGSVRLIADADMLDDRLWLADARWPDRSEAQASDVLPLLRGWVVEPAGNAAVPAPRRVFDDAALPVGMRWAILGAVGWVALGWLGFRAMFGRKPPVFSAEGAPIDP